MSSIDAADKVCIVSFGNSTKYRLTLSGNHMQAKDLAAEVRDYLEKNFPELNSIEFYSKMTVSPVTPENSDEFKDYEPFSPQAVLEIEKTLSREVDNAEDVRSLNSNEKWGAGAEKKS